MKRAYCVVFFAVVVLVFSGVRMWAQDVPHEVDDIISQAEKPGEPTGNPTVTHDGDTEIKTWKDGKGNPVRIQRRIAGVLTSDTVVTRVWPNGTVAANKVVTYNIDGSFTYTQLFFRKDGQPVWGTKIKVDKKHKITEVSHAKRDAKSGQFGSWVPDPMSGLVGQDMEGDSVLPELPKETSSLGPPSSSGVFVSNDDYVQPGTLLADHFNVSAFGGFNFATNFDHQHLTFADSTGSSAFDECNDCNEVGSGFGLRIAYAFSPFDECEEYHLHLVNEVGFEASWLETQTNTRYKELLHQHQQTQLNTIPLFAYDKINFFNDSPFTPYLLFGAGAQVMDTSIRWVMPDGTIKEGAPTTVVPAIQFGIGVNYRVTHNLSLFGEYDHIIGFADSFTIEHAAGSDTSLNWNTGNIDQNRINVGLTYSFGWSGQ